MLRSGNRVAALLTLVGDVLKGATPVWIAQIWGTSESIIGLSAMGVLLGHLYPIYFGFKGGKGVATSLGIYIALMPLIAVCAVIIWILVAVISRYSSLAALIAAASTIPLSLFFYDGISYVGVAFAIAAVLVFTHRGNIERLKLGTESKLSFGR